MFNANNTSDGGILDVVVAGYLHYVLRQGFHMVMYESIH